VVSGCIEKTLGLSTPQQGADQAKSSTTAQRKQLLCVDALFPLVCSQAHIASGSGHEAAGKWQTPQVSATCEGRLTGGL